MKITTNSYSSAIGPFVLVLFVALCVLLLVHGLTSLQLPDSVPDCGGAEVLDALTQQCERVAS